MRILDCTLRDGGYNNNWAFTDFESQIYFENISRLPIDIVEIGYNEQKGNKFYGQYYYCSSEFTQKIKNNYDVDIALMINVKNFEQSEINSFSVDKSVSLYRLAVSPDNLEQALNLAKKIKQQNKEVALNIMYASQWKADDAFISKILNSSTFLDIVYVVDSFGSLFPKDVIKIFSSFKGRKFKLGFHAHNNLELAFANTITAIDCGAEIVDSTILGMGRGAGNLNTELLLPYLKKEVDFNTLANITNLFSKIKSKFPWGTNLPYMIGGFNDIPQSTVMDLVTNHFYDYKQIIDLLLNNNQISNNYKELKIKSNEKILIVGGGETIKDYLDGIIRYIENNPKTIIIFTSSKYLNLFENIPNQIYLCLTGIEIERYKKLAINNKVKFLIHSKKIDYHLNDLELSNTFYVEDSLFNNRFIHSTLSLALNSFDKLSDINKVMLIGFDGYTDNFHHQNENKTLFESLKKLDKEAVFLTPTRYPDQKVESIYKFI